MTLDSARAQKAGPGYPATTYAWYVVGVLVMTTILSYTDRQILSLLVDPIRQDLGISDTQIGLLLGTAFAVVYGLVGLPFGYMADRFSRRNLILLGIVLWSIGTICCGLAQTFTQLFLARMVVGIGEAVLTPASISLISDYFPPRKRGTATGVFLMGIAVGAGGAILFGGIILRLVESGILAGSSLDHMPSWRLVLLFLGVLGILPIILLSFLREPARQREGADPRDPLKDASSGLELLRDWRRLVPLLLAVATISLVDNAVLAWSPALLIREFGIDPSDLGLILGTLLMIGGGIGVLSGGFLGDWARARGGRSAQVYVCLAAACINIPVICLIISGSMVGVLAGLSFYILFSGIGTSAGISAILDVVPNQRRGFITAISFFLNVALGGGLGPPAVALTSDYLLAPGTGIGPAIFIIAVTGFALVAVAFYIAIRNSKEAVVPV